MSEEIQQQEREISKDTKQQTKEIEDNSATNHTQTEREKERETHTPLSPGRHTTLDFCIALQVCAALQRKSVVEGVMHQIEGVLKRHL